MLKNLILIAATLAMTACVTHAPTPEIINTPSPEQIKASSDAGERYFKMKRSNTLVATCWNKRACERMFGLTKVFINQYSDMGIQHSGSYTVATFTPVTYTPDDSALPANLGKVAMSAVRKPGNDDASTIVIAATCSGLEAELDVLNNADRHIQSDPAFDHVCLDKLTAIYEAFTPYLDSRMK
ncbi:MAG: hypothetical protein R8M11_05715 [Gallionella sp.]